GGANGPFNPATVISDSAFLASGSLSASGIQTFLNAQSGTLKSYSAPDHNGVTKTAAQIIADAAQAWGVSPKVILVTLQKEQSLLAATSPSQYAYDWAMGCGKTDSTTYPQYQGFGNQVWFGAKTLSVNRAYWQQGVSINVDGVPVAPTNASTFSLYLYTPHFAGVTSFSGLYRLYFGDPTQ
ncbi:MAG: hypothetical protein HGA39_08020, partial [Coriobacteriia bacterium]|nr:hypothetical protein [Coriobacteriia bacterium]